jgi:hypothetical protein
VDPNDPIAKLNAIMSNLVVKASAPQNVQAHPQQQNQFQTNYGMQGQQPNNMMN